MAAASDPHAVLREVVEALAPLERGPCSPGEAQAAAWLADRLEAAGAHVEIEPAEATPQFAQTIAKLSAAGVAGGLLALVGARRTSALIGGAVAAAVVDDVSNGPRVFRSATTTALPTQNVVAQIGDPEAARTVVVLAHHDAAPTGKIFEATLQEDLGELLPGLIERIDTSLPQWWLVPAAPLLVAAGALRRKPAMVAAGTALGALAVTLMADIGRNRIVPGANDNLSACAVLVAVAEALRAEPAGGVRVLLVSCGAEEVLQGGIYAFRDRWLTQLDRDSTYIVNNDTVGSPRLILVEGEGAFLMEDYPRREFRDFAARCAERAGVGLRRGMRSRASTDGVVPARMGFPTVTFASIDRYKALSNYHLMSDTPENLDYSTVADAAKLTEEIIRALGRGEPA
jgi:Zn-dependent M28 family amino/carboxypeptidase